MIGLMKIPVNLITGFLGVGKTTAILDAFRHQPKGERWAVLVNEFGEVGIDGAALSHGSEYVVKEIAGGCICCTAGPMMKISIVRLLREEKPDRLLIEPTGLAHPATVLDVLRSPGLQELLEPKSVLGLVSPKQFAQPRYRNHDTYQDQIHLADILLANRCDEASTEELAQFLNAANQWYPPKDLVQTIHFGALEKEWLDRDPRAHALTRGIHEHSPASPREEVPAGERREHTVDKISTCGWVFPTQVVFDRLHLTEVLQELVRPSSNDKPGVLRLKGVMRTRRSWLLIQGTPDTLTFQAINYRRDSRLEVITDTHMPQWDAIEEALMASQWKRPEK